MLNRQQNLVFQRQAEIVKAIAHPLRIAILDFLKNGEQCVNDISKHIGSERSNVSRHLSVMAAAGILEHRKDGLKVIYRLRAPCICEFLACATNFLKVQAKENEEFLKAL